MEIASYKVLVLNQNIEFPVWCIKVSILSYQLWLQQKPLQSTKTVSALQDTMAVMNLTHSMSIKHYWSYSFKVLIARVSWQSVLAFLVFLSAL